MAKLVKFPLKLADGTDARSLEELREHGDVKSIIQHYRSGTLARWLKAWKYEEQAQQVVQHNNQQIASSKANLQELFSLLEIPLDEVQFDQYCQNNVKDELVFSDMEDSGLGSTAMGEGVSVKDKLLPFFSTAGAEAERVKQELEQWEITETILDGGVVQINYASQKHQYFCSQQMQKGDDLYNEVAFTLKCQMRPLRGQERRRASSCGDLVFVEGNGDDIADFYIGKYPVTQKEWIEVMGDNPNNVEISPISVKLNGYNPSLSVGDLFPVTNITVNQMCEYCNKRSEMEGLTPVYVKNCTLGGWSSDSTYFTAWSSVRENSGYRIAGERQWLYAAKGGKHQDSYDYSGSDNPDEVAWHGGNSDDHAHEVGTKAPNSLGIYDMCGNVEEVCWGYDMTHYLQGRSFRVSVKTLSEMKYSDKIENNTKSMLVGFRVTRPVRGESSLT